jgi:hypothetical protein
MMPPQVEWIKNDPLKIWFEDSAVFLVALEVSDGWAYDIVTVSADGESMHLRTTDDEVYTAWDWTDFSFYAVLAGHGPKVKPI